MLGRRIKLERTRLDLNQKTLAEKVGVSQPTISGWENGESEPSASDLIQLADALGVTVEWLVRGDRPAPTPVPALETAGL